MRKKIILFLGIFVFMIIPKNVNAVDLDSFYRTYFNWNTMTWYDDGPTSVSKLVSSNSIYNNTYIYDFGTQRTGSNSDFLLNEIEMSNSNGNITTCNSQCDLDITYDFYLTTQGATSLSSADYQVIVAYMQNFFEYYNNSISVIGNDMNGQLKRFYCRYETIDKNLSRDYYQNDTQNPYFHIGVTCNTANFSSIRGIELHFDLMNAFNTRYTLRVASHEFRFVAKPYTGTQDGDGTLDYTNGLDNINISINNMNDTMKDDSIDTNYQNSTLNNLNSQMASNNVISDLLLLPVRMYQKILNSLDNNSCSSYNLGSLYGTNLVLPCIQVQNYIGSTLWTTIDLIFCGMFVLVIRKKFVDIFNNMTNLKDRGNDIE